MAHPPRLSAVPHKDEKGWSRFGAWLWSKETFAGFEIEFEHTAQDKGNSGFYCHVGDKASAVKQGIEVQILDSNSCPSPESPATTTAAAPSPVCPTSPGAPMAQGRPTDQAAGRRFHASSEAPRHKPTFFSGHAPPNLSRCSP